MGKTIKNYEVLVIDNGLATILFQTNSAAKVKSFYKKLRDADGMPRIRVDGEIFPILDADYWAYGKKDKGELVVGCRAEAIRQSNRRAADRSRLSIERRKEK